MQSIWAMVFHLKRAGILLVVPLCVCVHILEVKLT